MNVPTFVNEKVIDEHGFLTESWRLCFSQLFDQMQNTVSDQNGFRIPQMSASDIAQQTDAPDGTHYYDTTINSPVVKKNGVFVTYG